MLLVKEFHMNKLATASTAGFASTGDLQEPLRRFYEEYTACLDDGDFDRWPSFFSDDAQYQITSRENYDRGLPVAAMSCDGIGMIRDRVTALTKVLVYEPRFWRRYVTNVRVLSAENGVLKSKANFLLIESMLDREPQINMLGQYVDVIVARGNGFLIKSRSCVYDNARILTTLFAPV
jgi:anthranilate 1,2-dioxygenase small subunit